jgi:hypothetical protein
MDAHSESPQMQLYLFDAAGAKPAVHSHIQAFHRTIPINWCASGGSDTHHKITIATDLHAEISAKLRRSEHDLAQSKTDYHKEKIRAVVDTKHALGKVRASAAPRTAGFVTSDYLLFVLLPRYWRAVPRTSAVSVWI